MMSYREIGLLMGFSPEGIRKIERRAIKKLLQIAELRTIKTEYEDLEIRVSIWDTTDPLSKE